MVKINKVLWDLMYSPLNEAGVDCNVVDVGARNGMMGFPQNYADHATYIGFEPNRSEWEKLENKKTDSLKAGIQVASFKQEKYYNTAAWSENGEFPLYITEGPGSCTMMGHSVVKKASNMYRLSDGECSIHELHTKVVREENVKCATLDSIFGENESVIDLLKLDVEGAELNVLKGAEVLFDRGRVLFLKTEFLLTPYYHNCPLLGHQQTFLNDHKMLMIDMDLVHSRYSWGSPTTVSPLEDRQFIYAGDAYFVKDPDRWEMDPIEMHRLGLIACVYGFYSFSCNLFRKAALLDEQEIRILEEAFSRSSIKSKIKRGIFGFPRRLKKRYLR